MIAIFTNWWEIIVVGLNKDGSLNDTGNILIGRNLREYSKIEVDVDIGQVGLADLTTSPSCRLSRHRGPGSSLEYTQRKPNQNYFSIEDTY